MIRHAKSRSLVSVASLSAVLGLCLLAGPLSAQDAPQWRHGLSLMGEPKYPEGFKHFDYVNPDAPKAGVLRLSADGTFDSLNDIIPRGTPAGGLQLIYDTLMSPAVDEVATEYGLLAEAGVTVLGGTSLFRLVQTPAADRLFRQLGTAGIFVRRFPEHPEWLRLGLPGDESRWKRTGAVLARFGTS